MKFKGHILLMGHLINNIQKRFLISVIFCTLAQFLCADWKYFTCTIITQPPSMSSQSDSQTKFKPTMAILTMHPSLRPTFLSRQTAHLSPPIGDGKFWKGKEVRVCYLQIGESCTVIVTGLVQRIRHSVVKCPTTSINKHLLNLPYHLTPSCF